MPVRVVGIAADIRSINDGVEKAVREFGIGLFQAIVSGTPVDTGYARGNWFVDFGRANTRTTGSPASPPGIPSGSQINSWRVNAGNLVIHNSVEYITFLDAGSSAQAPQGIVDPAIAAVEGRFGRVVI